MAVLLCCCSRYCLFVWRTFWRKRRGEPDLWHLLLFIWSLAGGNTPCKMCLVAQGTNSLLVGRWGADAVIVLVLGFEDTLSLSDAVGEKYADPSARIAYQGLWQASLCSAEQGTAPKVLGSLRRRTITSNCVGLSLQS